MSEFYRCSICGNPMFAGYLCPKCSANGLKSCEVKTTNWQEQKTIAELQKRIDFVENKADQFNEGFQAARNGEPDRPIELEESNAWMEGYAYGAYLPMKQRITELESQLRWIPVSEPPAESMYVLICNAGDEYTNPAWYATDKCGFYWCRNGNWYTLEEWNTRPLEDTLQARIAELEAENKALKARMDAA